MIHVLATIVAALAALLHVYIFWMESIGWQRPQIWKRFGVSDQATADATQPMAYNQGFYNLFLAVGTIVGIVLFWTGAPDTAARVSGFAVMFFALASMLAASVVLATSGKKYLRPAVVQGALPLIALVLLLLA